MHKFYVLIRSSFNNFSLEKLFHYLIYLISLLELIKNSLILALVDHFLYVKLIL